MSKIILLFTFFFSLTSHCADLDLSWDKVHGAIGAEYFSNMSKRGIITYGGQQLIPIYSLDLGSPDLQLVGSAITFRTPLKDENWLFRSRLYFDSTLDQPLYFTEEEKKEDRVRREITHELDLFLEYRFQQRGELTLMISQDLSAHSGTYGEISGRLVLGNFLPKNNSSLLQPALFATLGGGTQNHNSYLYGEGASGLSLTNYSVGLSISSPAVIDIFYPVVKITYFKVLGDENRSASHVKERSGWQALALFAFRVF